MMEFYIDASLYVGLTKAYGNFNGKITLAFCPSKDDVISFSAPINRNVKPTTIKDFFGQLSVTKVIFTPGNDGSVSLALEDITVNNEDDAKELVTYLTNGFGLYFDEY